ncbi:hypothetical protein BU16DRAFT_343086 [Lophium mytilinum]|uniref:Uncharacterized protein n=1 Tax=Lophium mytilinum TaxID=390894 RepID=A0A6A6QXI6_9PEZI|nr:hypothetical protein BU16DRAFT_343086 [Lophium mytilinum]
METRPAYIKIHNTKGTTPYPPRRKHNSMHKYYTSLGALSHLSTNQPPQLLSHNGFCHLKHLFYSLIFYILITFTQLYYGACWSI